MLWEQTNDVWYSEESHSLKTDLNGCITAVDSNMGHNTVLGSAEMLEKLPWIDSYKECHDRRVKGKEIGGGPVQTPCSYEAWTVFWCPQRKTHDAPWKFSLQKTLLDMVSVKNGDSFKLLFFLYFIKCFFSSIRLCFSFLPPLHTSMISIYISKSQLQKVDIIWVHLWVCVCCFYAVVTFQGQASQVFFFVVLFSVVFREMSQTFPVIFFPMKSFSWYIRVGSRRGNRDWCSSSVARLTKKK